MIPLSRAAIQVDFHTNFARVVLIYSILMAGWGLFLYVRGNNPSPGYLGSLAIAQGVFLVQAIAGIIVYATGPKHAHDGLHYLYGLVLLLTLPAAYFYSSGGTERRDSLIFGFASLFLVGIAIRGITTGGT